MPSNASLWQKIDQFSFKALGDGAFFKKLMKHHRWSAVFTSQAIEEYRKFMYLAVISDGAVVPSKTIDAVWHMHLLYTENYWDVFCPTVLGRKIHHHPSNNIRAAKKKDKENFAKTIELYQKEFKERPPLAIWNPILRVIRLIVLLLGVLGFGWLWLIAMIPTTIAVVFLSVVLVAFLCYSLLSVPKDHIRHWKRKEKKRYDIDWSSRRSGSGQGEPNIWTLIVGAIGLYLMNYVMFKRRR